MGFFNIISLALLALGYFPEPDSLYEKLVSQKWVVLVAGSSGYDNYRHQADICHAYQIVLKNGIPRKNIITMMVDDIANNKHNPTPGTIINKPNGTNVYSGVQIDYSGLEVNPRNFLNVITGNKRAMMYIGTGKVVLGGPLDTVFINFVDHGGPGILGFPHQLLYADQLISALNSMFARRSYSKMLIYIEACNAGSMFQRLLSNNTNIAVVTASNPHENSFGCYCDQESGIYYTCLGDTFSTTWMEDDDEMYEYSPGSKVTVSDQYQKVKSQVNSSHVTFYGDQRVAGEILYEFIGYPKRKYKIITSETVSTESPKNVTISSREIPIRTIEYNADRAPFSSQQIIEFEQELLQIDKMRSTIDGIFQLVHSEIVVARPDVKDEIGEIDQPKQLDLALDIFPCYRSILDQITASCFSVPENPYTFEKLKIFANLCVVDKRIYRTVQDIIIKTCTNTTITNFINVF